MSWKRIPGIMILIVAAFLVVFQSQAESPAQEPALQEAEPSPSFHLLDRGSANPNDAGQGPQGTTMMATLAAGSATPGLTSVGVVTSPTMLPPPAFIGNFFNAPADFPSSWYPFDVTGVFAWQTHAPSPPGSLFLGAGVAPGPFSGGMGTMWAAFGTAAVPVPPFMTPGIIGMPGNLVPPLPVPSGPSPLGVACGLYSAPTPIGPLLGGIVPPASPRDYQTFNGPPLGSDVLLPPPTLGLFVQWAAGCYVSGATVPVELQAFHIQ